MSKFQPKDSELPPSNVLLEIATVTDSDLDSAKKNWKENAPSEFKNLLEAEIRNE